jgi:CheY-like chemotaxis protein
MQQTQKLESLGGMAGGIAHDFNNLLTPILGDASLALMDLPRDSPARIRLEKIQKVAHQAAALTHQMLDYAGMGSLQTEPLDVTSLVREMEQLLESTVARKARLAYELHPDLPGVEADATQLRQVLLNLVANAAEATRGGGGAGSRIAIRSGALEIEAEALRQLLLGDSRPGGTYVYLEVEDTGDGMDSLTLARVFDPFFTTKFTGRGLGLAAVLGIVRGHGGAIEVDSVPDRGTRVRVLLPVAGAPLRPAVEPGPDRWRGSGTVLVADDDEGVRELTAETLTRAGLQVLCAADGREAVETFREHADEIGVVVLDRTMPGASGEEAFEEIRRIRADARIILVSGYSRDSTARRYSGTPFASFLQKPFLPETLVDRVRQLFRD